MEFKIALLGTFQIIKGLQFLNTQRVAWLTLRLFKMNFLRIDIKMFAIRTMIMMVVSKVNIGIFYKL
jgi:hypothetical protein